MLLKYQKLKNYKFRVTEEDCLVTYLNNDLVVALKGKKEYIHPYFTIDENGVTARCQAIIDGKRTCKGYSWDGASYLPWQPKCLRISSLIHDIGCQAINSGMMDRKYRSLFDKEFYLQSLKYGTWKPFAVLLYLIVNLWGKIPKKEKKFEFEKVYEIVIKQ